MGRFPKEWTVPDPACLLAAAGCASTARSAYAADGLPFQALVLGAALRRPPGALWLTRSTVRRLKDHSVWRTRRPTTALCVFPKNRDNLPVCSRQNLGVP